MYLIHLVVITARKKLLVYLNWQTGVVIF